MKLGVYTAVLHDKPVAEAVRAISDLGLDSAEINSGGFCPRPPASGGYPGQPGRPR